MIKQQKNGKGGKRPNSGRKKMSQPKVKIFLNIPPLLKNYLTLTNTNAGTLTRYLLEKYFDDVLNIDISCWQDKPTNFINVSGRWIFEDWKKEGKKYINPNNPNYCIKKTNRKPGKYQNTSIINTYIYKRMVLYCKKNNIKLTKLMPELLFNYFEKKGIHKSCWKTNTNTNTNKLKTYTLNNNNILFFDDFIIGKIGSKEIIIAPVHDI